MACPMRWETPSEQERPELVVEKTNKRSKRPNGYVRRLVVATTLGSATALCAVLGVSSHCLGEHKLQALQFDAATSGKSVFAGQPMIERRVGFVIVSGTMVNRTHRPLKQVEAVVDLLDANRHPIRTETAMIDRAAVAPGSASSFRLEMTDSPAAAAYRLRFRKISGVDLN